MLLNIAIYPEVKNLQEKSPIRFIDEKKKENDKQCKKIDKKI